MAELVPLDCEPPATESVVRVLETLLEAAREGKISSVGCAYVYRDGATGSSYSKMPSFGTLIGSVAILQAELIDHLLDKRES